MPCHARCQVASPDAGTGEASAHQTRWAYTHRFGSSPARRRCADGESIHLYTVAGWKVKREDEVVGRAAAARHFERPCGCECRAAAARHSLNRLSGWSADEYARISAMEMCWSNV